MYSAKYNRDIMSWVRNAFDEAISVVQSGRYKWFRSRVGTVTFKNGEFYV